MPAHILANSSFLFLAPCLEKLELRSTHELTNKYRNCIDAYTLATTDWTDCGLSSLSTSIIDITAENIIVSSDLKKNQMNIPHHSSELRFIRHTFNPTIRKTHRTEFTTRQNTRTRQLYLCSNLRVSP